jgi:DNA-binding GntR family transcriptional regulator
MSSYETAEIAVRRAALTLEPKRIDKLAKRFGSLIKKGNRMSFEEMRDAWSELFDAVLESLGNRRFMRIYSDLFRQVEVVRRFSASSLERMVEAVRLGEQLVQALARRDVDQAEALLKLHRKKSKEAIFRALS